MMNRILCLDIGDKRIGVAVSDPFNSMALPYETIFRKNTRLDIELILKIAKEKETNRIVCGVPLNFDGSRCLQTDKAEHFIEELSKCTDLEIIKIDERFTTKSANRLLIEADMRREKRKEVVDKVAASFILENYLRKINKN